MRRITTTSRWYRACNSRTLACSNKCRHCSSSYSSSTSSNSSSRVSSSYYSSSSRRRRRRSKPRTKCRNQVSSTPCNSSPTSSSTSRCPQCNRTLLSSSGQPRLTKTSSSSSSSRPNPTQLLALAKYPGSLSTLSNPPNTTCHSRSSKSLATRASNSLAPRRSTLPRRSSSSSKACWQACPTPRLLHTASQTLARSSCKRSSKSQG